MALVVNDRVRETSTTTGTGTFSLAGAVTGFETFVAGIGNSNTTYYAISNQANGEFEVGLGTVTDASPDTLARTTIISSSNSDSAVDFSAGTKDVFCTLPASKAVIKDASGNIDTNSANILIDDAHFIGDENGNEQIIFQTTSSAVNQFDVTNAATSNPPSIQATGGDSNIDFNIGAKGTGHVTILGNTNSGTIQFNCENNSHGQQIKGAAHSVGSSAVLTIPDLTGDMIVGKLGGTNFTNSILIGHATTGTLNSAERNFGIGGQSLQAITSGDDNMCLGYQSGKDVTTGSKNTLLGSAASYTISTQSENTAIGYTAGAVIAGNYNTVIGSKAGDSIGAADFNLCLGRESGENITTGAGNVMIGSVDAGSATGDRQLKIAGYDGSTTTTWISGNSDGDLTFAHDVILANDSFIQFGDAGETIAGDGTDLTITSSGDINIDAGGADINFKDDGTKFGHLKQSSNNMEFKSEISDADIKFKGNDGGSVITALTLDMSAAGAAIFNDKITAVGTSVFTNLDISGDIDVDGTTNLDVVDIDGAVDMASTLTVTGAAILNGGIDVAGDFIFDIGGGDLAFKDDGTSVVNFGLESGNFIMNAVSSDTDIQIKGNDGGSPITALTFDMSDAGKATFNGVVNANAGVVVDNISIDGTEIDLSSGDLTIDVAGDITLDAGGGDIRFDAGGSEYGKINLSGNNVNIHSTINDADIVFKGIDNSSDITALTLDMSAAGAATFNSTVQATGFNINGAYTLPNADGSANQVLTTDGSGAVTFQTPTTGDITSVVAGSGLTGGATSGAATLNIGAGTGIDVAADAISVDVSDFMANGSNNRIVTATGADAQNAEANLTFDGSELDVSGTLKADKGYVPEATLTDGSTINWDMSTQSVCKVTLAGNRTMAAPSNGSTGQFASITVIQDGTGSRTLTWNATYEFAADTAPTLTTTASKADLFVFRYNGSKWLEVGRNQELTVS